jgi:hypothetical protein
VQGKRKLQTGNGKLGTGNAGFGQRYNRLAIVHDGSSVGSLFAYPYVSEIQGPRYNLNGGLGLI